MVWEDCLNDKCIIVYIVVEEKELINFLEICFYVLESLVNYMILLVFVVLEELLLMLNGKVDRKKLFVFDFNGMNNERVVRNLKEEILCDLFVEVFGVFWISIDDNFFEMGGYLFFVFCLMVRICEMLSVELGIGKLFELLIVVELV